jgi:hypothetical protein
VGTKLFIVSRDADGFFTLPDGRKVDTHDVPVGAMWRCTCHDERGWLIRIPGEDTWPDGHVFNNLWCTLLGDEQDRRWDVSGEAPMITVSPSIHRNPGGGAARGEWHGHIIAGEIVG